MLKIDRARKNYLTSETLPEIRDKMAVARAH